jgi:poly-beta-hydroxyalkanoate depolymerase
MNDVAPTIAEIPKLPSLPSLMDAPLSLATAATNLIFRTSKGAAKDFADYANALTLPWQIGLARDDARMDEKRGRPIPPVDFGIRSVRIGDRIVPVEATPHRLSDTCILWEFCAQGVAHTGPDIVVNNPRSGSDATVSSALIASFLAHRRVYATEWVDAHHLPMLDPRKRFHRRCDKPSGSLRPHWLGHCRAKC